jgi:hypothetical protein
MKKWKKTRASSHIIPKLKTKAKKNMQAFKLRYSNPKNDSKQIITQLSITRITSSTKHVASSKRKVTESKGKEGEPATMSLLIITRRMWQRHRGFPVGRSTKAGGIITK